ncbi:MAG: 6,7-dimethyl-8-ribityllumazine synthase [Steroidobacteraceae bacterium]
MSKASPGERRRDARERRIAIVASRFNDSIVAKLLEAAVETWREHGGDDSRLAIARVPGAFELPIAARRFALSKRYDGVVALGCVIRGETAHFDYVAGECARGLQLAALETGVPIAFGVLTVDTVEQALERAGPTSGNKGAEAMLTALDMAELFTQI